MTSSTKGNGERPTSLPVDIEALCERLENHAPFYLHGEPFTPPIMAQAAATIRALQARVETMEKYARKASIALTRLSGGGSEMFLTIAGQFYADPSLCVQRAEDKIDTFQTLFVRYLTKGHGHDE